MVTPFYRNPDNIWNISLTLQAVVLDIYKLDRQTLPL